MFRRPRRLLRRAIRRGFVPIPVPIGTLMPDAPRRRLARAHAMMQSAAYAEAAQLFSGLAEEARSAGHPRAAQLSLEAGRAHMLAGQPEAAASEIREGLEILAAMQRWGILRAAGDRAVAELRQHGMTQEAEDLAAWLNNELVAAPESPQPQGGPSGRTALLPTHCPQCGGAMRSAEIEWIDPRTAECAYCGSPVRAA